MTLFEYLSKRLSAIAQALGKRTSEVAELSRLTLRMDNLHQDLDALYIQIGKAYHSAHAAGEPAENAEKLCAHVDALLQSVNAVQRQIDRVKKQRRCPKCGGVQPSTSCFCAACGAKMPDEEIVPEELTAAFEAPQAAPDGAVPAVSPEPPQAAPESAKGSQPV